MKFMARILIAMLVIAMMCCVVGCNGNNAGTNDVENENAGTNNVVDTNPKQEEIIDDYYVPDTENLVGIAVYPVDDRNNYPYACGEKVTNLSDWKFIYQIDENTYAYDDNIVRRSEGYGTFVSDKNFYWGYVYVDNNNYYIIATHDYCDLMDESDYRMVCEETISLTAYVIDVVPNAYAFEYSWFDFKTTAIVDVVEYSDDEVPSSIVLPSRDSHNIFCVKYMNNGENIDIGINIFTNILYDSIRDNGGSMSLEFNGFKNGESYQYYIDLIHPDFQ
jgi:hypothetical protein